MEITFYGDQVFYFSVEVFLFSKFYENKGKHGGLTMTLDDKSL